MDYWRTILHVVKGFSNSIIFMLYIYNIVYTHIHIHTHVCIHTYTYTTEEKKTTHFLL